MGHLSHSLRFFAEGRITRKRMARAVLAARVELEPVERAYREAGWQRCVGSSGTALAVEGILRASGWSEAGIGVEGLSKLREAVIAASSADALDLPALKDERRPVLAGGVALLTALFEALEIERMEVSEWALREGLLYDLLGRLSHDDVRERTIQRIADSFQVDAEQAGRVETTALALFEETHEAWKLDAEEGQRFLRWASRLHELGIGLNYSGYHKHGAYVVGHADLPGFSRENQRSLAALIRSHRRRLRHGVFEELPAELAESTLKLSLLLRLAVILHRSRSPRPLPELHVKARPHRIRVRFPEDWLEEHPLTRDDLEQEARAWRAAGYRLRLQGVADASAA